MIPLVHPLHIQSRGWVLSRCLRSFASDQVAAWRPQRSVSASVPAQAPVDKPTCLKAQLKRSTGKWRKCWAAVGTSNGIFRNYGSCLAFACHLKFIVQMQSAVVCCACCCGALGNGQYTLLHDVSHRMLQLIFTCARAEALRILPVFGSSCASYDTFMSNTQHANILSSCSLPVSRTLHRT
jgi:hypothetical protein